MRVLVFYQYFTTPAGAWSTRWYDFARRWIDAGVAVTVVTCAYDKSDLRPRRWVERRTIDGIDVIIVGVRQAQRHGWLTRIGTYALFAAVSVWFAVRLPADVVIASSGPLTVGVPGLVAHWVRRTPLVMEVRDLWPEGAIQLGALRHPILIRLARWLERRCYRSASMVVALSPGMEEGVRAVAPGVRTAVVSNAADVQRFTPGTPARPFEVVYAGSLGLMDDGAQVVALAEALARRGRDDIRVVVLGDGGERQALEARGRGLARLSFEGLRPKGEVAQRLAGALCAVVTYRGVPVLGTVSPNKLFDALAAGVPVVQTTGGWIRALLEREECGFTVSPLDPEAMADAVTVLADRPDLRAQMAAAARRLAEREFSVDGLAKRYLMSVREVLAIE